MADNVTVTEGSGKIVASDEISSVNYQRVKLTDGTAESTTPVNTDIGPKTNALRTAPASDITDATYIGDIKFGEAEPNTTAILADTASMDTNIGTLAGAIAGSEMQVDVVAPLPAGTNAIGKLAANSGVDIGDVDVTSVPAPLNITGGGAEATALRVTLANDSTGVVSVDDGGGSLTVDGTITANAGTNLNTSALATESGGNLDTIAGDTTSLDAKIINNGGVEAGAILVTIANNSTGLLSVDDNGSSLTVDGTITANAGTNLNTSALAVETGGNLDTISGDTTSIDGKITACNTGAVVISSALPAGSNNIGEVESIGDIAHDAADSGNPVKVGGKAVNVDGTVPGTAVTEGDRTNFITDVYGRQCVETSHPNFWKATDNQSTPQTNNELVATPGAGLSLYVTDILISNGATAGSIKFVEDTGTPVDIVELLYFGVNGGTKVTFATPLKLTANKNFGYTSISVTTHSITVSGHIAP